ncbi:FHA domain-containing protein, partial [Streptomyces sp. NPDC005921]
MAPVLVGLEGLLAGERIPVLDTRVTFGRNAENTVVISSLSVSRFHAEIVFDEDKGYVLRDLESPTVFDVSQAMRARGWHLPAYTFPAP